MLVSDSNQTQEHDVDAIIANAYGHSNPSADAPSQDKSEPAAPSEPQFKEYEFNARGQAIKVKENDPRFQQWLSQGYDYSQSMNSFNNERKTWEQQKADLEKSFSPYREIDEFAQKNPDWWQHVDQSYKEKLSNPVQIPDAVKSYLEPIIKDYSMIKTFAQDYQRQQVEKQERDEDQQLQETIKSIQGKHKDLDFSVKDESGLSLEKRVIDFALQKGIPDFEIAFKAYYHDNLVKQAESRARESYMQEMEKRKKMGILDHPAPISKISEPLFAPRSNNKPRSWNDLKSEDILKEMNFS